ncbi:hypothetical protein LNQ52_19830 [Klebsiella pneumoniae subsp. pneumoniae]|nr:hypothetical protein [Klebsiella pneumoniae subsp. pneumoniae]
MHLGLGIYLSNAMGYVVGIVFSFIAKYNKYLHLRNQSVSID